MFKDTQALVTRAGRDPSVGHCQDLSLNHDSILQSSGAFQTFLKVSKRLTSETVMTPCRPYKD